MPPKTTPWNGGDRPPVERARPGRAGGRRRAGRSALRAVRRRAPRAAPARRRPGSRISARSRSSSPGLDAPRPARSPARRRRAAGAGRAGRGAAPPRRPAGRASRAPPGQRERVPAVLAADALDDPPQRVRRGASTARSRSSMYRRAAGPVRVGRQRVGRARRAPTRDRPAGLDVGVADALASASAHRLVEAEQARRAGRGRTRAMSCSWQTDLVAQRLDQRPGDARSAPG